MENIISLDSNGTNGSIANENLECIKITHKNGVDNVRDNELVSEYDDDDDNDDDDDDDDDELSEFNAYRDHEFESDDDELDSTLDFKFDFDIIFSPENNSQLDHLTEIKSKIINKIKLSKIDLLYIQKIDEDDKFELIKIFNHMV
jgi:hypothetical protein